MRFLMRRGAFAQLPYVQAVVCKWIFKNVLFKRGMLV